VEKTHNIWDVGYVCASECVALCVCEHDTKKEKMSVAHSAFSLFDFPEQFSKFPSCTLVFVYVCWLHGKVSALNVCCRVFFVSGPLGESFVFSSVLQPSIRQLSGGAWCGGEAQRIRSNENSRSSFKWLWVGYFFLAGSFFLSMKLVNICLLFSVSLGQIWNFVFLLCNMSLLVTSIMENGTSCKILGMALWLVFLFASLPFFFTLPLHCFIENSSNFNAVDVFPVVGDVKNLFSLQVTNDLHSQSS
jgi:hypothetical protein